MDPSTTASESGPGLSINLSSNNPFRNQVLGASPASTPGLPPYATAPVRQSQTNPFLASFEQDLKSKGTLMESTAASTTTTTTNDIGDDAKELFKQLTFSDEDRAGKSSSSGPRRGPPPPSRGLSTASRQPRNEDVQYRRGPNGLRIPIRPRQGGGERSRGDVSRERSARRRNSESSIRDKPQLTEEERRERDKRRREREQRHRDRAENREGKESEISTAKGSRPRRRHVDVVDQMDVTGLYGVGGMWHHDGPFDACRPDRNRKKDNMAPINAFPLNSANNTMGGSGPLNAGINIDQYHGRGAEGYNDYGSTAYYDEARPFPSMKAMQALVVNPINRVEPIHGEESLGLGTSTFLEGAPASRQAIQRTQSEQASSGISRKKSLAVRLRAMSTSKRYNDDNRPRPGGSRDVDPSRRDDGRGLFQDRSAGVSLEDGPASPPLPPQIPALGARPSTAKAENWKPVEADVLERTSYDDAYERKGASIKTAEADKGKAVSPPLGSPPLGSPQAQLIDLGSPPASPVAETKGVLSRRSTDQNITDMFPAVPSTEGTKEGKGLGNSLLSRVKSLKGGPRKVRAERNPS